MKKKKLVIYFMFFICLVVTNLGCSGCSYVTLNNVAADTSTQTKVVYFSEKNVKTGLTKLTLAGSVKTPIKKSKEFAVAYKDQYIISFDYVTKGGTNKFTVDLCSGLYKKQLTAKTTAKHYDWIITIGDKNINKCILQFKDDVADSNEKDITLSNIIMHKTVKVQKRVVGEKIGTLPKLTKTDYTFLGWYTSETGGKKVTASTKLANSTLIKYYPRFMKTGADSIALSASSVSLGYKSKVKINATLTPTEVYNTKINWTSSNPSVATVDSEGTVTGVSLGTATITAESNNKTAICNVTVVKGTNPISVVASQTLSSKYKNETVNVGFDGATKAQGDVTYKIVSQKNSSNTAVSSFSLPDVSVPEIKIAASIAGTYTVVVRATAKGNSNYESGSKNITLTVNIAKPSITFDYYPKTTIKVGETTMINLNSKHKNDTKITFKSSNTKVATVSNGKIVGKAKGTAKITVYYENIDIKTFTINVLPKTGKISGAGGFWGYKSLNAKTPVLATSTFFKSLAKNGTGTFQSSKYVISSGGVKYTYNTSSEILSVGNKTIRLRIYYPQGVDLSTTNTLVYMGGRGESNFGGVFSDAKKNPAVIKSGGIVALIAEGKNASFDGDCGAYVTKFLKAITKQKSGVKNSILGFSDGAHYVFHALKNETYNRVVVFSGYMDVYSEYKNAKNTEIIFMIASGDGNYTQAQTALRNLIKQGFKNLSMVSMGTNLKSFESSALIINPGSKLMKNGHFSENVINSGIIQYLND